VKVEARIDSHSMTKHTFIFGIALTVVFIGMLFLNAISY
jgi:hypothetical protein